MEDGEFVFLNVSVLLTSPLIQSGTGVDVVSGGGDARTGLSALFTFFLIFAGIVLLYIIFLIYRHTIGKKMRTTLAEDYRKEAERLEKSGRFVSAAHIYQSQLKEEERAADLYEKGEDYRQAALMYEALGSAAKAKEMWRKNGNLENAALISVQEGDYEEAAKLYYESGMKVDAAMMLERAGRRMAAVRAYREAGEYRKAAELMEEEGMLKEAAEMFGISLGDRKVAECIDDFYAYALKLERAGENQRALEVFKAIDRESEDYRDVKERLVAVSPPPVEEDLGSRTTLRSFIRSGRIEPRHALKLWIHVLRALQEAYESGRRYGALSPDSIAIDANNNISFISSASPSVYASPESERGSEPDECSDIYSAGIILYEMLIGNLEGLGMTRIKNTVEDVPDWLDDIAVKCLRKVREDRYESIELIFSDIKALSAKKRDGQS